MVLAIRPERNDDDDLRKVSHRQQDQQGENATERLSVGVVVSSRNLPRRWNVVRFGFGLDHEQQKQRHQRTFQQLFEYRLQQE